MNPEATSQHWLLSLSLTVLLLASLAPAVAGQDILQPNWPEPGCIDGTVVNDPFCTTGSGGADDGGGGFAWEVCGFDKNFNLDCVEVDVGETGYSDCEIKNNGTTCSATQLSCGRT